MGTIATFEGPSVPVAEIDPRIRARRIEVRRDAGRRRLQRLVDLGVVAVVALGFLGALWTPLLDVDEVRVTGAAHTGADVVLARSGVEVGARLSAVDLGTAGRRIAELPWVQEVRLHRGVGGVVAIEVVERAAVAVVGSGAAAALVDRDGRVLGPAAGAADVGPVVALVGTAPAPPPGRFLEAAAADALVVAERLQAALPGAISTLQLEDLTGTLATGGAVRFGDATQLDAKLRSLRTVLDQVDLTCLARIDLGLPGTPVLTREERCS